VSDDVEDDDRARRTQEQPKEFWRVLRVADSSAARRFAVPQQRLAAKSPG
jgi:hypothetical protein